EAPPSRRTGAPADTCTDDPAVAQLMQTARRVEACAPCPAPRRAREHVAAGFCLVSLYADGGQDNAGPLSPGPCLAAAARGGAAITCLCAGADVDIDRSPILQGAIRLGWTNVASGYPGERDRTFGQHK
ncbi:unnamed protein product, partial [Prorocentrum cordatum]